MNMLLDHKKRNVYCSKCGNNGLCTFRALNKTEIEIITRCANYNNWIGTQKYREVIQTIKDRHISQT